MKAFILSVVAMVVIAYAAAAVLSLVHMSASDVYSVQSNVRL